MLKRSATLISVLALALSAGAGRADELSAKVDASVDLGVKYLYSLQQDEGDFKCEGYEKEGSTALVLLALMSAGESPSKPELRKAITWLSHREIDRTYALGLRAAALSQLAGADKNPVLRNDVRRLMAIQIDRGLDRGLYTYGPPRGEAGGDLSNSQYGVLGVWYAAEAGIEVPKGYWQRVEDAWTGIQNIDGGFGYRRGMVGFEGSYASMTAAGVATLSITHDFLHAFEAGTNRGKDAGKNSKSALAAAKAVDWIGQNFAADRNTGHDLAGPRAQRLGLPGINVLLGGSYINYMLFGYERVGEATGLTRFGNQRWYEAGAKFLTSTQSADGQWEGGTFAGGIDTAYAILFLARGRSPVILQKLQLDTHTNNRARDAASLVKWARKQTERHVNWQLTRLDYDMSDLRQAPILYLASDEAAKIPEAQWAPLKQYIDEGGLLLVADESADGRLAKSMEDLLERFYPRYVLRDLPKDHPFITSNFKAGDLDVPVRGLSNGVRELAVILPKGDFPWRWQKSMGTVPAKSPEYALFGNILVNITGRTNLRYKGSYHLEDLDASKPAVGVRWQIARIQYGGNWNPEPAAYTALAARLHNAGIAELTPYVEAFTDRTLAGIPLAHLTATHTPDLTDAEERGLQVYIEHGGLLLVDAAGGDPTVGPWAENLLRKLYPSIVLKDLPTTHPIYAGALSADLKIDYRAAAADRVGGRRAEPHLRGAYLNGRLVAVVSSEDLISGLTGFPHDGIIGYAPEAARTMVTNLLRYAYGNDRS